MSNHLGKVSSLLKAFLTYCPYCVAGKKVAQVASGKKNIKKKTVSKEIEKDLIEGIKMGRFFALIGLFCPFFWISVFAGANIQVIKFNAIHSGIVILGGIVIMIFFQFRLNKLRK